MTYDFNTPIIRKNEGNVKWDFSAEEHGHDDLIGMGIADTEFAIPENILNALKERLNHPILGYDYMNLNNFQNIADMFAKKANFHFDPNVLVFCAGIMPGIAAAIEVFSDMGDEILFENPGYSPLKTVALAKKRTIIENPLVYDEKERTYSMDFEATEKRITKKTKLWLICNPHNPTSRVWTKEELKKIVEIAVKHDLLIISDEIHSFMNYPENPYTPIASVSKEAADRTITLTAPSKMFNVAGLFHSMVIITNPVLQQKFADFSMDTGIAFERRSGLGIKLLERAYTEESFEWLKQKTAYLKENDQFLSNYLAQHIPNIIPVKSDGLFLKWLDFRKLNLSEKEIMHKLIHEAKIVLSVGTHFGSQGEGFFRMNIGCSRQLLEEALNRLAKVFGN